MSDWRETILGPRAPGSDDDHFRIRHWLEIRGRLRSEEFDLGWARAVSAFERRFARRFIDPADDLLKKDKEDEVPEGRGFAVIALDCLLLESLYGYKTGSHTGPGATSEAFERTLLEDPFEPWFRPHHRAARFGRAVRNSILHDGETRDGWIVWKAWTPDEGMIEALPDGSTRIRRDVFHAAVKLYVGRYFTDLQQAGEVGIELRENFKCRVNELCRDSEPPSRAAQRTLGTSERKAPRPPTSN